MQTKIKLNDGTELNVLVIYSKQIYHQEKNRSDLEFVFTKGTYPFEQLDSLFSDRTKTSKMTVITVADDNTETQNVYDDYSMKVSMIQEPRQIGDEVVAEGALPTEKIIITMAQLSLIEKKLIELGLM